MQSRGLASRGGSVLAFVLLGGIVYAPRFDRCALWQAQVVQCGAGGVIPRVQ